MHIYVFVVIPDRRVRNCLRFSRLWDEILQFKDFLSLLPPSKPPPNRVGTSFKVYPETLITSPHLHVYLEGPSHCPLSPRFVQLPPSGFLCFCRCLSSVYSLHSCWNDPLQSKWDHVTPLNKILPKKRLHLIQSLVRDLNNPTHVALTLFLPCHYLLLFSPAYFPPLLTSLSLNISRTSFPQGACICCSHYRETPLPTSHITTPAASSGLFANVISVESSLTTLVKSTSPPSFPLSSFSYHLTYCLLSFFVCFLPRCKLNVGRASVSFIHCCVPRRVLDS